MKKFLQRSAGFLMLFASITLVFIIVLEKELGTITNSYSLKRQQLESQADSIEVLVLGSSQSLHGVNPSYFSLKGYNVSNMSQSLFYDESITLKYLNKMPKLKYVLIAISDFSFTFQLIDTEDKWRDYFYAQYWDIKFPEVKSTDLYLHSKILLYTPEISLVYALELFHVDLTKDYYRNGWARMSYPVADLNDFNEYKRILYRPASYNPKRYESIKHSLDLFLRELQKRNITPVFFTPPVTSFYYKHADQGKLDSMHTAISEVCDKYNCKYFDYFKDPRFLNTDFGDWDHLNTSGAEKFSKILNEDILKKD